ncbi:MAG: hypothetical protein ABIG42_10945 [bacterium]
MRNIRIIVYPAMFLFAFSFCLPLFGQASQTFDAFQTDPDVVKDSRFKPESGGVFSDLDGDGLYDSVKVKDMELTCEIDEENAFGVTYPDGKKIVYYPSMDSSVPMPGEFSLYGFIHLFDENSSIYFAVVINRIAPEEEEQLKRTTAKMVPYKAAFIDSNGLRVGIPSLILLPFAKLAYNADFQKFLKSPDTVLLGTNPQARDRELFIFRKIPSTKDALLLIHYKWW